MTTIAAILYLLKKFGGRILTWSKNVLDKWLEGGFEEASRENGFLREFPDSPEAYRIRAQRESDAFIARNLLP
jgi:hypothetical protein